MQCKLHNQPYPIHSQNSSQDTKKKDRKTIEDTAEEESVSN